MRRLIAATVLAGTAALTASLAVSASTDTLAAGAGPQVVACCKG
jgi:hypothetical protein